MHRKFGLGHYFARLEAKGYDVKARTDSNGVVRGYILQKGNTRFKASELSKGRNLMASKLEDTWKSLHGNDRKQTQSDSGDDAMRPDYSSYIPGSRKIDIDYEGETYTRYIPNQIAGLFEVEFDFREVENWADLINEACYHFVVAMSFMAFLNVQTYTSGGGGASNNDLPKKRDDLEEEIARARRCAEAARSKIGIVKRKGIRR